MKILIGCEESQAVCIEFRKLGHEAYSCDLQECSGGHPEWHIIADIFDVINGGTFTLQNGDYVYIKKWDLGIFFYPCTDLSKAGGWCWKYKQEAQQKALNDIRKIFACDIEKIALENPVGKISTAIRKPNQIIHPWMFGDPWMKETCIWVRGLPILIPTNIVQPSGNWVKPGNKRPHRKFDDVKEGGKGKAKLRSKTFPGIANAMANQWGSFPSPTNG